MSSSDVCVVIGGHTHPKDVRTCGNVATSRMVVVRTQYADSLLSAPAML